MDRQGTEFEAHVEAYTKHKLDQKAQLDDLESLTLNLIDGLAQAQLEGVESRTSAALDAAVAETARASQTGLEAFALPDP